MKLNHFCSGFFALLLFVTVAHTPVQAVDHGSWNQILTKYVDGGFFDYRRFMDAPEDRKKLKSYLKSMSTVKPASLSRDEQLAFWINLYNAATIELIARNYPVDSIKDTGGWFSSPWKKSFITVNGASLTLDQIEHEIIRPDFDEPRIHFALVCAAKSCPPLRNEAYVGSRLDGQLEEQTNEFLNSSKNQFRVRDGTLRIKLSSIFYWYQEDFGGREGLPNYLKPYLSESKAEFITRDQYSIEYLDYNWSLNQAPGPYPN